MCAGTCSKTGCPLAQPITEAEVIISKECHLLAIYLGLLMRYNALRHADHYLRFEDAAAAAVDFIGVGASSRGI